MKKKTTHKKIRNYIYNFKSRMNAKKKTEQSSKLPKKIASKKLIGKRIVFLIYTFILSIIILSFAFIITIIIPNIKIRYIKKQSPLSEIMQILATSNDTMLAFWLFLILFIISILLFLLVESEDLRKHLKTLTLILMAIINSKMILQFNETRSLFKDTFLYLPKINIELQHMYTVQEKLDYIMQLCQQNQITLSEHIIYNLAQKNVPLSELPNLIQQASNVSPFPSNQTWWAIIHSIPATCNVISFCENHWKISVTAIVLSISVITTMFVYSLQNTPNNPLPTTQGTYNTYIEYLQTITFLEVAVILFAIINTIILIYWVYSNQKKIYEKLYTWKQKIKKLINNQN